MFDEFVERNEVEREEYCEALYETFKKLSDKELRLQFLGVTLGDTGELSEEEHNDRSKIIGRILNEREIENFVKGVFTQIMYRIAHIEYKKVQWTRCFALTVDSSFSAIYRLINEKIKNAELRLDIGVFHDEDMREKMREKITILKDVKKDLRKQKKEYLRIAKETEAQILQNSQDTEFCSRVEKVVREEYRKLIKTYQFKQWVHDMDEEKFVNVKVSHIVGYYLYPTEANIKDYVRSWFECNPKS